MTFRSVVLLAAAGAVAACAQTIPVSLNFSLTTQVRTQRTITTAQRPLTGLGVVGIRADLGYPRGNGGVRQGNETGTITIAFNRLDSFVIAVELPNGPGSPAGARNFTSSITGGTGAYQGATGSVAFTYNSDSFGVGNLAGNGSVTAAGKTTSFAFSPALFLTGFPVGGDHNAFTGTGTVSPGGNVNVKMTFDSESNQLRNTAVITLTFNATDSVTLFLSYNADGPPPANTPAAVIGGTGLYAGVTGSGTINVTQTSSSFEVTGSGTITGRPATAPVITEVSTAYGRGEISQNDFIVIKGKNLVPATTSKDGVIWSNAPEFITGKMPTTLQGIGVKVNDVPGYVYFFCSAATNPACSSDQINVLTPLDTIRGNVKVTVTNNGVESNPYIVQMNQAEPSFLVFNTLGYVAAVHANGNLIGPTTLYPGASTPATLGEQILVFAVGFGLPTTTLVQGSSTQFGPIATSTNPRSPVCFLGSMEATVTAVTLISPGLYQFNITVPANAVRGDNLFYCSFTPTGFGAATPVGNLLTVQ